MWFSDLGNAKRKTLRTNGSEEMGIRLIAGNESATHQKQKIFLTFN